jgi:hypothetical protein
MERKSKNIKISQKHHEILKSYCQDKGLKIYRVIEKWIDELDPDKKKGRERDIYGDYLK